MSVGHPERGIKMLGFVVGVLIFCMGMALWKLERYESVADDHASTFSTAGFVLMCIANEGVIHTDGFGLGVEAVGYLIAALYGVLRFAHITQHKQRFNGD